MNSAAGSSAPAAVGVDRSRALAAAMAREGNGQRVQNEWNAALRWYRLALDFDPDCYDAWVGLSASFLALSDVTRATGCLEVARTLGTR